MKLIMCVGLPGSGKTTWALREVAKSGVSICRVNKDDIRASLAADGTWKWSPENEKDVLRRRDIDIRTALSRGVSVISDDTNFARKHRVRLAELAKEYGAEFIVKRFNIPIEKCIRRDALRENPVGKSIIQGMADQYEVTEPCNITVSSGICEHGTKGCAVLHKHPEAALPALD